MNLPGSLISVTMRKEILGGAGLGVGEGETHTWVSISLAAAIKASKAKAGESVFRPFQERVIHFKRCEKLCKSRLRKGKVKVLLKGLEEHRIVPKTVGECGVAQVEKRGIVWSCG